MVGYKVYVDESGDEGFRFDSGCSHWFVLSAAITPKDTDLETVKLVDDVRSVLNRQPRAPLHFRRMKHEHRLPYIEKIAQANLKTVSILIHKPSILEPEKFSEKHLLYRYATRLLLERVSWYCRDHRTDAKANALVVFSNRASMSYDYIRDYLKHLKAHTREFDVRIEWSAVNPDKIAVDQHHRLMGLQIADAVASGTWYGVEKSRQGFTEPRYAQMLQSKVYGHRGRRLGYGFKLWPKEVNTMIRESPELAWISETYQQK